MRRVEEALLLVSAARHTVLRDAKNSRFASSSTGGFVFPPTALEKPSAAWRGQRLQGLPEGGAEVSRALPYVSTLLRETEYRAANCRAPVQLAARNLSLALGWSRV